MAFSRLARTFVVIGFLLALPGELLACDSVSVGPREEQYEAYRGMIVHGRVVGLELLPNSNVLKVKLRILRVLRGTWNRETMTGYSTIFGVACSGFDFRIGQEYVVFPGQLKSLSDFFRRELFNPPADGLWFGGGYTLDLRVPANFEILRKLGALPRR